MQRLVSVSALLLAMGSTLALGAAPSAPPTDDPRPVVVGTGNRLSGRVPVLFVGGTGRSHPAAKALAALAEIVAARSDLTVELATAPTLTAATPAYPLVFFARPPTGDEDETLRRRLVAGACTAAVFGIDTPKCLPASLFTAVDGEWKRRAGDADDRLLADLPAAGANDPGFTACSLGGGGVQRLFLLRAGSPRHLEPFVVFLLRHAILRGGGVRYLPTVFRRITPVHADGQITLAVDTARPGALSLSLIDLGGETVLEEGPLRPIDPGRVADPENSLVRLRYRGDGGLREEARFWFRELTPEHLAALRLHGPARLPVGEPLRLRLAAVAGDGRPLPGLEVAAGAGPGVVRTRTDGHGSAWLELPPFPAEAVGAQRVPVRVAGPGIARDLVAGLTVVPRPARLVVETDRPVYRPGGRVQVRLLVVDAISRKAASGRKVTVRFRVEDRDVEIARLEAVTDGFGAAVVMLPLATESVEDIYRITAETEGATAAATFRVESLVRPRFAVRVTLDETSYEGLEPVTGTIRAATLAGAPLAGAKVRASLLAGEAPPALDRVLDADGRAKFTFAAREKRVWTDTLSIVVSHQGATVTRTRPVRYLGADKFRVTCRTEPSPLLVGRPGRIILGLERLFPARRPAPKRMVTRFSWRIDDGPLHRPRPDEPRAEVVIPVPPARKARAFTLHAFAGYVGTATPIEIVPGLALACPGPVKSGSRLSVRVDATFDEGLVHLDLASRGRLLAAGAGRLDGGRTRIDLAVPADFAGPARLTVRLADDPTFATAHRTLRVVAERLTVRVKAEPETAAPGDDVQLTARVTDAAGRPVAALLDVRGYDRAYREHARARREATGRGPVDPLGLDLGAELEAGDAGSGATLLDCREPAVARARFAHRAGQLARPLLVKAGRDGGTLPWGGRIVRTRVGDYLLVQGEPPITVVPGTTRAPVPPGPSAMVADTSPAPLLSVRHLLPVHGPHAGWRRLARGSSIDHGLEPWLARCQAPDGSFRAFAPAAVIALEPGEAPGDPGLEPANTALVMLAALGAGYTHEAGRLKEMMRAALDHLLTEQRGDGFIGDPEAPWAFLNHAIGTLALTEAFGMSNSPALRPPVRRALAALIARQRADGAFAEAHFTRPSLTATAWAVQALKAAKSAGLEVDRAAFEGVAAWFDAAADRKTGAVPPSAEEIAAYPFPGLSRPPQAAAMTALTRIYLGFSPQKNSVLRKLEKVLLAHLPQPGDSDLHGHWWGTCAMFQIGGPAWKRWNRAMKAAIIEAQVKTGTARGSWRGGGRLGRIATTSFGVMSLETYYRYGKVFGEKNGHGLAPRRRFADLLVADLARRTNATGYAEIPLRLPDNLTPWDVRVGAWDGRGRWGRAGTTVTAHRPLRVEIDLPSRLFVGDRFRVPVRVGNDLDLPLGAELRVVRADGLAIEPEKPVAVSAPACGSALAWLTVRAVKPGRARLTVQVVSGAFRDAVERSATVASTAVRFRAAYPVSLADGIRLDAVLPKDARDLRGRLRATAGPLADTLTGLDGLIRRPTGCFEQTAATLYPAVLALRVLHATGRSGPALEKRAREHLLAGYQRLVRFEVEGGGFSLYGREPVSADLTALGIHLLLDLRKTIAVDEDLLRRAAKALAATRPDGRAAAGWYARAALRRTGRSGGRGPVVERGATVYRVALVAAEGGARDEAEADAIRAFLESKAERRGEQAVWSPGEATLFAGGARSRVETTALAVTALARTGGSPGLIRGGLRSLRAARAIDGAWPTTRETVAALRALITAGRAAAAEGTVTVGRRLRPQMRVALRGIAGRGEVALGGLDRSERIAVGFRGRGTPEVTLLVEGSSDRPPTGGGLALTVGWPEQSVTAGAAFEAEVTLRRSGKTPCHAPLVEIPIPGGCRPDVVRLQAAARSYGFSRVEVKAGTIWLYLARLAAGEARTIRLPFLAGLPGRFFSGRGRAWPYYAPEEFTVSGVAMVEVHER